MERHATNPTMCSCGHELLFDQNAGDNYGLYCPDCDKLKRKQYKLVVDNKLFYLGMLKEKAS